MRLLTAPRLDVHSGGAGWTPRLKRSVYEYIVTLDESHELEVRLDGARVVEFQVGGDGPGKPGLRTFSGGFMVAGSARYPTQDWDERDPVF